MKKLLNTSDRIRLALALGEDVVNKLFGGDGSTNWYYRPWEVLNISNSTYQVTVRRLLGSGEITKEVNVKGEAVYRMSPKGELKYFRVYPLAKLREQKWDRIWRMIIYDLPCKYDHQRDILRNKLIELGFGCYQKSVYVTPLNVLAELKSYINENNLAESVVLFEGNRIFGEDIKDLADKIWHLNDINFSYLELERKIIQQEAEGKIKTNYNQIWDDFTVIALSDPFLPVDFLPNGWAGERVKRKLLVAKR